MARIPGSVPLTGVIATTDDTDTFPVIDPQYGIDGLRNVNTIQEMYNIPPLRRKLGMLVGVGINGTAGNYYYLTSDIGNTTTDISNWTVFEPGGAITFYDEGSALGTFSKVNFVGQDVSAIQKPGDSTTLNVYIPSPTYASHYNTNDGSPSGVVVETLSRNNVRISTPTAEGNPFKTGGWAGTTQSATTSITPVYSTSNPVTGQGGSATIKVDVLDADNSTVLSTFTTPVTANGSASSAGPNAGITVTVSGYSQDSLKYKASITVSVNADTVLGIAGRAGGRYQVRITNVTDSATDAGQTFIFLSTPVFLDVNPNTPSFSGPGSTTIVESTPSSKVITKHLSGVEYYALGSKFDAGATGINNLNANTQGKNGSDSENFTISAANFGLPTISVKAWSPTQGTFSNWTNAWNNQGAQYNITDWAISATSFRYRGSGANAIASLFDPWNPGGTKTSASQSILVDTYATTGNSTKLIETFDDEEFRVESDYTTSWLTTATLTNGEACVVGGTLVRPDRFFLTDPNTSYFQPNLSLFKPDKNGSNPNYSGLSNDASYYRLFYNTLNPSTTPIPSFRMIFAGTWEGANALADLKSEALKIFVRKIGASVPSYNYGPTSPPLNLHGPSGYDSGAFNDGDTTNGNNAQIRLGSSSGNTIDGTFGGFNATKGIYVEVRICSPTIRIDTITVSFN